MIIKVIEPTSNNSSSKRYFEVDDSFKLGDIVVFEKNGADTYGVIVKLNMNTKQRLNTSSIRVASEYDRVLFWYEFEQHFLKNKVKLGKVALEQYRETSSNRSLSTEELINKMTRNMMLLHKTKRIYITKNGALRFNYGCLQLTYASGKIHYMKNNQPIPKGWKKDWDKHWYYSKILGVELN